MRSTRKFLSVLVPILAFSAVTRAQTSAATAVQSDSSYIDPQGTAHIGRIIPVPQTVSPEAQQALAHAAPDTSDNRSLPDQRALIDGMELGLAQAARQIYPATVTHDKIAGVPVVVVVPPTIGPGKDDHVLINLHGGGFVSDSGSVSESIPVASLTKTKVISVLYRLAPEHPFPAPVDDVVAVYRELLKTYKPGNIAIYGTSAGAVLTGETAVKLKELNLPLPAALGMFSGGGDFSKAGDSVAIFSLGGFAGHWDPPSAPGTLLAPFYSGTTDPKDPVLSPVYADLKGMPPTLFLSSTRDTLLSGTAILHRAFLRAGVDARLIVFEALPHAFWNDPRFPESREANDYIAKFLDSHLGR